MKVESNFLGRKIKIKDLVLLSKTSIFKYFLHLKLSLLRILNVYVSNRDFHLVIKSLLDELSNEVKNFKHTLYKHMLYTSVHQGTHLRLSSKDGIRYENHKRHR